MSGTIDGYRFEDVTKDTLYVMRDVRRTIDGWAKRTHEIDLDYNPYEGRDEREKLDMVVTKNIVDSVKDRLYNIDTKNKVIKGVDVEALRCAIGRSDFDTFFGKSTNFRDDLSPEDSVQLMDPIDSVIYCRKHGYEYPKEFSGVVLKSATGTLQSLLSAADTDEEYYKIEQGFVELADGIRGAYGYCNDVAPELLDHFQECAVYLRDVADDISLSGNKNEFVNKICDDCIHDESDRMKAVFAFVEQAQRKAINMSEPEFENDGQEIEF